MVFADLDPELHRLPLWEGRLGNGSTRAILMAATIGPKRQVRWPGRETRRHDRRQSDRVRRAGPLAVLLVVLALAGCASVTAGPEQGQNPSYPQSEPRDTSGMH